VYFIVFDISNVESFQVHVPYYLNLIKTVAPNSLCFLLGNKLDKRQQAKSSSTSVVTKQAIEHFMKENKYNIHSYCECSALTGEKIGKATNHALDIVLKCNEIVTMVKTSHEEDEQDNQSSRASQQKQCSMQ